MAKGKNKLNKSNSSGWLDNYSEESAINEYQKGGEVKGKKSTLTKLKKALSLRENLGNLNTEEGYNTPLNQILRTAVGMEGKDLSNESMSPIAREQDAFRMYLGLPSKTGAFEQTGSNKYRIRDYDKLYPDTLLSDKAVKDWGVPYEDGVPDPVNKAFDLYPYDDFVMGKHYITKGKDAKGEYLRYYDKFDLDPTRRANQYIDRNINPRVGKYLKKATPILDKLENLIFNPFELEDKIYYDPKTKLRSDIILEQNKQRVVPGQPVAIPDFAGGGKVKDNKGYLISNLDNFTPKKIINSNYITTNNMAFPVEANGVVLYPNTGDYIFPTDKVTEIPIMQGGGRTNLPKSIPNDPLLSPGQYQQLNSLQNFKKYIESDKSKKNLEDYKKSEILRKIQENQASVSQSKEKTTADKLKKLVREPITTLTDQAEYNNLDLLFGTPGRVVTGAYSTAGNLLTPSTYPTLGKGAVNLVSNALTDENVYEGVNEDANRILGEGLDILDVMDMGVALKSLPYLNKLATPLAGTGEAFNNLGNKYLPNASKLNPFAKGKILNRWDENSFLRQVDEETYREGVESGLIKGKQNIGQRGVGDINLNKAFGDDAYYNKGSLYYKNNKDLPYLFEANLPEEKFIPKVNGRTKKYTTENTSVRVSKEPLSINDPNITIYKKDWLKGYKEVPKKQNGGEINNDMKKKLKKYQAGGYLYKEIPDWAYNLLNSKINY
jgi:hypothetical protein